MNSPQSRHEKSLGLLTTRFVELLQEAQDGVLDLKNASIIFYIWKPLRKVVTWFCFDWCASCM